MNTIKQNLFSAILNYPQKMIVNTFTKVKKDNKMARFIAGLLVGILIGTV